MKKLVILTLTTIFLTQANAQNWDEVIKAVAADRAAADYFGSSVSISGDYAIVGAFIEDEDATGGNTMNDAGSVYLFEPSITGVGIIENDLGSSLIVYPNPGTGEFIIDLGRSYRDVSVTVSNLMGQIISSDHFGNTQQFSIEIEEPTGFYLVEIQTAQGKSAMLKVLKE